jgi:hypothetical protein
LQMFQRLTRARRPTDVAEFEAPIRAEPFSAERLEQHAQSLAVAQTATRNPANERALVSRVRENGRVLQEAHTLIGNAAHIGGSLLVDPASARAPESMVDRARACLASRNHRAGHGLVKVRRHSSKSEAFHVVRPARRLGAIAAICVSHCEIGRPKLRRATTTTAA